MLQEWREPSERLDYAMREKNSIAQALCEQVQGSACALARKMLATRMVVPMLA